MRLSLNASSACVAMSVLTSSSGVRMRMRATSIATLPTPTTAARSTERSNWQVAVVGMGVVPGDELRRSVAACQVLTRDAHMAVGLCAGGEDHLVIVPRQVRQRHVPAVFDVAEEAEARVPGNRVVGARHVLDLGVVGRDAEPHQPVRRGQPLEHVDLGDERGLLEQLFDSIERGGPRTNDGNAERMISRSCIWHQARVHQSVVDNWWSAVLV